VAGPLKMRVQPVALPKVKEQHFFGIFGNFEDVIQLRITQLRRGDQSQNRIKIRFFEFLLNEVDARRYGEIQDYFLAPERIDPNADTVKYLDPLVWFESKIGFALRLGLDVTAPRRILDIGTGPGHFPVVARFFGHAAVGTEVARRAQGVQGSGHLYDALCDVFKVERIAHSVRPFGDLRGIPGRYDMLTSFLAGFNVDERKRPWDITHWNHFLACARRDVLTPGGIVFLNLANGKITAPVWGALKSAAEWFQDEQKSVYFSNLEAFGDDSLVAPAAAPTKASMAGRPNRGGVAGKRIQAM
jgi:hypothetical protein